MIPKIVHYIWFQGEQDMQQSQSEYWKNVQRTKELFGPCWEVRLWDEQSLSKLVAQVAPTVLERFNSIDQLAMKADIGRYVLLKEYGGVYLDADFLVARSLEPLCYLTSGPYVALRRLHFSNLVHSLLNGTISSKPESMQTYLLISNPQHPLWDILIEHIAHFRNPYFFEPAAFYYCRYTSLTALGWAVHRYKTETIKEKQTPIIHITHISEFYGSHIGKGEWAGWLTTYGNIRRLLSHHLNWFAACSVAVNVILIILCLIFIFS